MTKPKIDLTVPIGTELAVRLQDLTPAEEPAASDDADLEAILSECRPIDIQVLRLHMDLVPHNEIAKALDVAPMTVQNIMNRSAVKQLLAYYKRQAADHLSVSFISATDVLTKSLRSDSEKIRLAAAKTVIDRQDRLDKSNETASKGSGGSPETVIQQIITNHFHNK